MDIRRGFFVAMTTMALASGVTPAWAITEGDCTGLYGGSTSEEGGSRVCRFPIRDDLDWDTCDAVSGFPVEMDDASYMCTAPINESSTPPRSPDEDSQEFAG